MGQPPQQPVSFGLLAFEAATTAADALLRLHTQNDPGLARMRRARLFRLQVDLFPSALANPSVETSEPGALDGVLPGMESNEQLAEGRPNADHSAHIHSERFGLLCDDAQEAFIHTLCHHSRGVHHWAPRKVLALGLAVHGLQPCQAQAQKGHGGEEGTCEVLRHGQGSKDDALALSPWHCAEDAVLIHQPTLRRHSPEGKTR
mmetsp:Transcript_13387/g.29498  ORF Transcript_13387/g.29498 Transcript_13387/m.29498 type:complete len:203 (-) Transcript_13387:675-1283(-)